MMEAVLSNADHPEYAGALDGNSINDLNDVIRVAEQVSDYAIFLMKMRLS